MPKHWLPPYVGWQSSEPPTTKAAPSRASIHGLNHALNAAPGHLASRCAGKCSSCQLGCPDTGKTACTVQVEGSALWGGTACRTEEGLQLSGAT